MATANKKSAVRVQKLWYGDVLTAAPTLATIATSVTSMTEVENVHQDTWSVEEDAASVTSYKNELNGQVYRQDKTMGDVKINFTIGQYDFTTKAALLGGTATESDWSRSREITDIKKCIVGLTYDNLYVVFPNASVVANENNTDNATGLAVVATAMLPTDTAIASEYWFDKDKAA